MPPLPPVHASMLPASSLLCLASLCSHASARLSLCVHASFLRACILPVSASSASARVWGTVVVSAAVVPWCHGAVVPWWRGAVVPLFRYTGGLLSCILAGWTRRGGRREALRQGITKVQCGAGRCRQHNLWRKKPDLCRKNATRSSTAWSKRAKWAWIAVGDVFWQMRMRCRKWSFPPPLRFPPALRASSFHPALRARSSTSWTARRREGEM
jgi:hypothetical protein